MACLFQCGNCSRFPCNQVFNLNTELETFRVALNTTSNSIIADINNIVLPDTSEMLESFNTLLKSIPNDTISSLPEMSQNLGLPDNNDSERLATLGLINIFGAMYLSQDSDNFKTYQKLYNALGKDFSKFKKVINGDYGNYVLICSSLNLKKFVSPSQRYLTVDEISSLVGYTIFQEDVLQYDEKGLKISVVYEEILLDINQSLSSIATKTGIDQSSILTKVFGLSGKEFNNYELKKFKNYGLSTQQLSTIQGIITPISTTLLEETIPLMTTSITEIDIKKGINNVQNFYAYYSYEFLTLDDSLLPYLSQKNSETEIEYALKNYNWIQGINPTSTSDDIFTKISDINNVEGGTVAISNKLLSQTIDTFNQNKTQTIIVLLYLNALLEKDDASWLQSIIADLIASISGVMTTSNKIVFKSYDSGSSMALRNLDANKTFEIRIQLEATLSSDISIPSYSTQAIANVLLALFNTAEKTINALMSKVKTTLAEIERMTSIGLSLNGIGAFESSFLKCKAGIAFDLNFSPLTDILNKGIDKYTKFLDEIAISISKIIAEFTCKVNCLEEALGLKESNIDLPFCQLTLPPLVDLAPVLNAITKYLTIFDMMLVAQLSNTTVLQYGLLDMQRSFTTVKDDTCNCEPLSPIFNLLKQSIQVASITAGALTSIQAASQTVQSAIKSAKAVTSSAIAQGTQSLKSTIKPPRLF